MFYQREVQKSTGTGSVPFADPMHTFGQGTQTPVAREKRGTLLGRETHARVPWLVFFEDPLKVETAFCIALARRVKPSRLEGCVSCLRLHFLQSNAV